MSMGISAAGWTAIAISAAVSAAGTGLSYSASQSAAKNQRDIVNAAAEEEAQLNNQKKDVTEKFVADNFNQADRNNRLEGAAQDNESSLIDSLLKAQGGTASEVKSGAEGNLSSDYTRASGEATANSTADILRKARLMARSNAPGLLYTQEALKAGDMNSDIAGLNSQSALNKQRANVDMWNVDNGGSLAGGLLSGLAPVAGMAAGAAVNKTPTAGMKMTGKPMNGWPGA